MVSLPQVKQSPLMLNHRTQSTTSKLRSKIRKEFHRISNVSSSPANSLKMAVPSPTTISKKNPLFILFFVYVEEVKKGRRRFIPNPRRLRELAKLSHWPLLSITELRKGIRLLGWGNTHRLLVLVVSWRSTMIVTTVESPEPLFCTMIWKSKLIC